jgi:hypothetical protein
MYIILTVVLLVTQLHDNEVGSNTTFGNTPSNPPLAGGQYPT